MRHSIFLMNLKFHVFSPPEALNMLKIHIFLVILHLHSHHSVCRHNLEVYSILISSKWNFDTFTGWKEWVEKHSLDFVISLPIYGQGEVFIYLVLHSGSRRPHLGIWWMGPHFFLCLNNINEIASLGLKMHKSNWYGFCCHWFWKIRR